MSISKKISALLKLRGLRQGDLMEALEMGSKQSLSNKFSNERWSAGDLVKVAAVCGCELAFILPDGQKLKLDDESSGQ